MSEVSELCKDSSSISGVFVALWGLFEFWLGRTPKLKAGSTLELIFNSAKWLTKRKESKMDLGHGLSLDYAGGEVVAKLKVAVPVLAWLDEQKAKIESGEIDPIKGTDLDKAALLQAIELLKGLVAA